jgi:hypothetical protein
MVTDQLQLNSGSDVEARLLADVGPVNVAQGAEAEAVLGVLKS